MVLLSAIFVIFVVWPIYAMIYEPAEMQKLGSSLRNKGHRRDDTYFERMKKR